MVSSITSKSAVASISELGIEEKDEQVLSTTTIESTGYCIKVKYEESNTCDIYYLNYDGKLIEKIYHDEDDETKDTVSIDCYEKDNHVLELEYETKNLVGEVDLLGDDTTTINKTIKFGKDGIDISKFSNREMFAISIDFSDVDESQIENNIVKFDLNVDGVEKICTFNKIPYKVLAVPALIKDLNGSVEINVTFSKNINLNSLKKIYIYRCDATINEYNEDEHLVCSITRDNDIVFEDYDGDNPTSCITTDRYGITKTSKALFDASGRTIYEEDGDGNCKETYYDEKGNIIETREYNKNNSSLAKVSKTKYDDDGNAVEIDGLMRDKNGKYPQKKTTYLSGTDVVSSVIYPNGQVIAYGYDFNTGLLTEKASDANGQNNATQYGYIANYLISLAHHGVKFNYTLDNKGRKLSTKLNDQEIISTKYEDNYTDSSITNGEKVTTTFANGFESVTISDKDGDLISTNTNDGDSLVYEYDDRDRLVKVDHNSGTDTVVTTYDLYDKIVSNEYKCKNQTIKEDISYDDHGRVASKTETADDILTTTTFIYCDGKDNLVEEISIGDTKQKFEYDALGRTVRKELTHLDNTLIEESFEYLRYGENSLNLVKEHDVQVGGVISDTTEYEYDVAGNITLVKRDEFETCYKYDELGRLIREDNPNLNKTIIYKYDTGGNILLKKEYQYSLENRLYSPNIISYTYASKGYKDQLINFNGEAISYDIMGRPTSIGSHNLSWDKKGNLIGYDETTYTYSFDGTRISKTINGVKTSYVVLGGKILAEKSEDKDIIYRYSSDKLVGFSYNGVEYIYERNIQGDILRIYQRDNLTLVAEYNYDAYGNHEIKEITEANIGHINPFRYRGYYFDAESGWYHLNTRYYSPLMGRFISPDDLSILDETKSQINGLNLYMYCGDNPVMNIDPSGQSWWSDFWSGVGGIVVGVVVSAAEIVAGIALICTGYGIGLGAGLLSTGIGSLISGSMNALNGGSFIAGWTGGQVSGLISTVFSLAIPTFGDYVGGAIGSFVGTAVSGYIDRALGYNSLTDGQIFLNASISSFLSIVTTFAISGFNNTINPNLGLSLSRTTGPTRSTIINNLIFGFINGIFPAIYEDVFFKLNMTRKRQN